MRPPEFTGGNLSGSEAQNRLVRARFNEAAGIHRRKHDGKGGRRRTNRARFNEAAGIHRRKRTRINSRLGWQMPSALRGVISDPLESTCARDIGGYYNPYLCVCQRPGAVRAVLGGARGTGPLGRRRQRPSHDDGLPLERVEWFAQTGHLRLRGVGDADVDEHHVIFPMVYQTIEFGNQFGLTAAVHPTLEHGELDPSAVAVHELEYLSPAARIGDVVGDDVEMLFHRPIVS